MKQLMVVVAIGYLCSALPAYAEWADPSAAYLCDSKTVRFSMKSIMETSEPDQGTVRREPGYSSVYTDDDFKCDVGPIHVRANIVVDPPHETGTCAGFTHTYLRSLRVNGKELFHERTFNSACDSNPELYKIEVQQRGARVHVQSCYATWAWEVGYKQTKCDEIDL